jgi:hypothetical protein
VPHVPDEIFDADDYLHFYGPLLSPERSDAEIELMTRLLDLEHASRSRGAMASIERTAYLAFAETDATTATAQSLTRTIPLRPGQHMRPTGVVRTLGPRAPLCAAARLATRRCYHARSAEFSHNAAAQWRQTASLGIVGSGVLRSMRRIASWGPGGSRLRCRESARRGRAGG